MGSFRVIVIGCSAGGLRALEVILSRLPADFHLPIAIVQHLSYDSPGILTTHLAERARIAVKEAEDKEPLAPRTAFIAPPNYHLLIEEGGFLSLSMDEKENYCRPSIDVLFESAAEVYGSELVGVILTGANADGTSGLKRIHERGGTTVVQEPGSAEAPAMPISALRSVKVHHVLPLEKIAELLSSLGAPRMGERRSDA